MRGADSSQNRWGKAAFTLAEVLITLGIIGVVAALTMPVLIENHKKQVIISKLDKAYSTISNAYVLAKESNGDMENWGLVEYQSATKNEEDFLYYISPFLSVQKYCVRPKVAFRMLNTALSELLTLE